MTLNSKLIALSLMALTISLITACGSSPESLYKKGKDYFDGNGVPVNQEKAVYFYRNPAAGAEETGDRTAMTAAAAAAARRRSTAP